jgi:hypothetical protein
MFPSALSGVRENADTGVPRHVVSEQFIKALCTGVVTAVKTLPINALGAGTLDVPGVPSPVPVTFPGIPVAQTYLIARQAWTGPSASLGAQIFVGSVLRNVSVLSVLVMPPNPLMGTGIGVVSPAANPGLEALALAALLAALPLAFQTSGFFGEGDIPGAPVNVRLLAQLPGYAEALAKGIATITTAVPYVGTGAPPTPVAGALSTGSLV